MPFISGTHYNIHLESIIITVVTNMSLFNESAERVDYTCDNL